MKEKDLLESVSGMEDTNERDEVIEAFQKNRMVLRWN